MILIAVGLAGLNFTKLELKAGIDFGELIIVIQSKK